MYAGCVGSWGVPLYVHRADVPALAQQSGEGIESAARRVRYDFFYSAAREHGCHAYSVGRITVATRLKPC